MSAARIPDGAPLGLTERERAKRTKTAVWKWTRCTRCGRQCDRLGYGRDGMRRCPDNGVHKPGLTPPP